MLGLHVYCYSKRDNIETETLRPLESLHHGQKNEKENELYRYFLKNDAIAYNRDISVLINL